MPRLKLHQRPAILVTRHLLVDKSDGPRVGDAMRFVARIFYPAGDGIRIPARQREILREVARIYIRMHGHEISRDEPLANARPKDRCLKLVKPREHPRPEPRRIKMLMRIAILRISRRGKKDLRK